VPQHRRVAMVLMCTLLATIASAGASSVVLAALDPTATCSPGQLPTTSNDDLHPPDTVRVLRSKGPNSGHVETVALWSYVGVVLRTEYGNGTGTSYPWMQSGALTVKQYAWYYAMHWRGGKVSFTNPEDGSVSTECYDLKDTTADQIYKPEKPDPNNPGAWLPANQPTAANLKAIRETWHFSLRKWQAKKNRSRLFLTGYRAGSQYPCGEDATGFRIYQKSLRDCATKSLTFEETAREYFEPNMLTVNSRAHDFVADGGQWRGDLGLLIGSGSDTQYRLYKGSATSFSAGPSGTFSGLNLGSVLGYGVAQVDAADANGADDDRMFADLVILTNSDRIKVARSNGDGFGSLTNFDVPAGAERLVVGDFDGDLIDDVGVLTSPTAGQAALWFMHRQANGGFDNAVEWWSGTLDLSDPAAFVAAADVNGDDMVDLVVRDATGAYLVAASSPSCADMTAWGSCPTTAVGTAGLNPLAVWLDPGATVAQGATSLVGDYDRDGRDDVIAVTNSSNFKVLGLRSLKEGGFANAQSMYQSGTAFAGVVPVAMDADPDGMVDLALVVKDGSSTDVQWLRTMERTANPASMVAAGGTSLNSGVNWSASPRPF
jgi:hypothetical protein